MANRLQTPLPNRCLLHQALLWVAEEFVPIDDRIFMSLPKRSWETIKEKHKRFVKEMGMINKENIDN